jgi:predicted  nucleic acid-binding Zn-ribbon protein
MAVDLIDAMKHEIAELRQKLADAEADIAELNEPLTFLAREIGKALGEPELAANSTLQSLVDDITRLEDAFDKLAAAWREQVKSVGGPHEAVILPALNKKIAAIRNTSNRRADGD